MVEHVSITDPNIHETKGAAAATAGQVLIATGAGTATFQNPPFSKVKMGWYDYNDTATTGTPIAISLANTYYDLTNNTLGPNTQTAYGIPGVTSIWNSGTNRFNFSGFSIGDTIDLRVDLSVITTSANTAVDVALEVGVGQPGAFLIPITIGENFKTAGTYRLVDNRSFYLGSSLTKDNPARLRIKADGTGASVVVNGWFTRIITRA